MRILTPVIALSLLAGSLTAHAWLESGSKAPAFSVKDTHGSPLKLEDQKGKYTILEWYHPKSRYVLKLYSTGKTQALQKKYADKNVTWITVNSSAPGSPGYQNDSQLKYDLSKHGATPDSSVVDANGELARLYDIQKAPEVVIIEPNGTIIYSGAIDDAQSWDPGDVEDAMNYIERFMDAALEGEDVDDSEPSNPPYGTPIR